MVGIRDILSRCLTLTMVQLTLTMLVLAIYGLAFLQYIRLLACL